METSVPDDLPPSYEECTGTPHNLENIELGDLSESKPLRPQKTEKQSGATQTIGPTRPTSGAGRYIHTVYENGKCLSWCHPRDYTHRSIITEKGTVPLCDLIETCPSRVCMCGHTYCMPFLLLTYGGFAVSLFFLIKGFIQLPNGFGVAQAVPAAVATLFYFFIYMEGCLSDTSTYLKNVMTEDKMRQHIEKQATAAPDITFSFKSQHSTDSDSSTTYRGCLQYRDFRECLCLAKLVEDLPPGQMLKVEFDIILAFKDNSTLEQYNTRKNAYYAENRYRESMKTTEKAEIPGFIEKALLYRGGNCVTLFPLRRGWYILATVLLLSFPYRWWLRSKSTKCKFTFVKIIG